MLAQRLRRWPDIETALGDYIMFAWTAMRVTPCSSRRLKSHHPDNTIQCCCNAGQQSVTLGQHYSNLITLSPNHEYNRNYIFFLALFKHV